MGKERYTIQSARAISRITRGKSPFYPGGSDSAKTIIPIWQHKFVINFLIDRRRTSGLGVRYVMLSDLPRHALGVDHVRIDSLATFDHGVPQNGPQRGLPATAGTHDNAPHTLVQGLFQLQHLPNLRREAGNIGIGVTYRGWSSIHGGVTYFDVSYFSLLRFGFEPCNISYFETKPRKNWRPHCGGMMMPL